MLGVLIMLQLQSGRVILGFRGNLSMVAEYELEGVVAKRRDGKYVPGSRSADWLKCLVSPRADVVIGGLVLDERRGARALLCGWMNDNGALTYAGEAYIPPYLGQWVDAATHGFRTDGSPFLGPFPDPTICSGVVEP